MDKQTDIFEGIPLDLSVDTFRSGPYRFQIGLDMDIIDPLIEQVKKSHDLFTSIPILPEIAADLEKEVLVSSVYGTDTIEGGTLTEYEIDQLLSSEISDTEPLDEKDRRIINIKNTYSMADKIVAELEDEVIAGVHGVMLLISEELIKNLHETITKGLCHPINVPGKYRNNPKGALTKVSDHAHGGIYTPPKCLVDIEQLMKVYVDWLNSENFSRLNPLIRASLAHYYFERIHPFGDGNGRTGRVIEALLLKSSGFVYAHYRLAREYLDHIDEYFTVFNTSRKAEESGEETPNTEFVKFFLLRIHEVIHVLHYRVNTMFGVIMFQNMVNAYHNDKTINDRQFSILDQMINTGKSWSALELRKLRWYQTIYKNVKSPKTMKRDLERIVNLGLVDEIDGIIKLKSL